MKTKEECIVKFNYQKEDGFYCIGKEVVVSVFVTRLKCNHKLAAKELLKQYPNAEIVRVSYV